MSGEPSHILMISTPSKLGTASVPQLEAQISESPQHVGVCSLHAEGDQIHCFTGPKAWLLRHDVLIHEPHSIPSPSRSMQSFPRTLSARIILACWLFFGIFAHHWHSEDGMSEEANGVRHEIGWKLNWRMLKIGVSGSWSPSLSELYGIFSRQGVTFTWLKSISEYRATEVEVVGKIREGERGKRTYLSAGDVEAPDCRHYETPVSMSLIQKVVRFVWSICLYWTPIAGKSNLSPIAYWARGSREAVGESRRKWVIILVARSKVGSRGVL